MKFSKSVGFSIFSQQKTATGELEFCQNVYQTMAFATKMACGVLAPTLKICDNVSLLKLMSCCKFVFQLKRLCCKVGHVMFMLGHV